MKKIFIQKRYGLFFEMGTGKTKIVLDFAGSMLHHKKIGRVLVLAPLSALATWEDEIRLNWSPDLKLNYFVLRPNCSPLWRRSHLVISNYDYAKRIKKELGEWAPDLVVIDESHRIKNPYAKQSKLAHYLGNICRYAIIMTGTPIGNHPLDLWSQFKFLVPGLLDEKFKDFKEKHVIYGGAGGYQIKKYKRLDELGKKIAPFARSLKKSEYLSLPKKNFILCPVEMGERARQMYKTMEEDFVAYIEKDKTVTAPIALAKLTKLSQISGGFIRDTKTEEDHPVHEAKLEVLKGLTDDLLEQDSKRVVIFARFKWELNKIRELLSPDWCTYQISGEISPGERKLAQSLFSSNGGAMICQIASGSASMNLQTCNYTIFYSVDYSHINFMQAQDRTHRIGQTLPCFYYLLACKATLDREIYRILRQKKDVADEVIRLIKERNVHS